MKNNKIQNKWLGTNTLFFLFAMYAVASFTWWGILLIEKTQQIYSLQNGLLTDPTDVLRPKYNRQILMIIGEGVVFMSILLFGVYKIYQVLRHELYLKKLQKNFLLSVSHELKSPLTSIKISLEGLLKNEISLDKKNKLISNSIHDVGRLENLIEKILLTSKIENHSFVFHFKHINLISFLDKIVKRYNEYCHFSIDLSGNEHFIKADETTLASSIHNIIENAIKYNKGDNKIHLKLKEANEMYKIEIADLGKGIPDEEKDKIFEKFYRSEQEEIRQTKGTGLGLYIAREIVTAHGGKISVKNNIPNGAIFEIVLPKEMEYTNY